MDVMRQYIFDGSEGPSSPGKSVSSPGKKGKSGLRGLSVILLFLLVFLVALPRIGHAESSSPAAREYRLRFFHTHTGERLNIVYRRGDQYIPEALDQLDHYLRDHRTGDVHHFDPRL